MQALTRLNPTDPVRFDGMNTILGEIEGRDEDLLNKINDCLYSKKTLLLEQDLIAYIKSLTRPETFYAGRCTNAPEENSYFVVSVFIGGGGDKHIIASQFNAYGACKKWEGDIWNNEFKGWQQIATTDTTSVNKVLTTLEEANNPNLESGIYSCEGGGVAVAFKEGIESHYYVLIVNQHRINMGYGVQIAIPYDNGWQRGIYYRVCAAGTWGNWVELGENKIQRLTLLEGLTQGQWCSNIVNKVGNTLTFRLNFFLPSNWSSGKVIFYLPEGMRPTEVIHVFDDQGQITFDITQSGACVLYGGVAGQQYVFNKSTVI